jgi:hypothetical protein
MMSSKQIEAAVFRNQARRTTVLRRLRILERAGLIRKTGATLTDATTVWTLAPKGLKTVGAERSYGTINRNVLEHDVLVGDARIALDSVGIGTGWQPGFVLKQIAGETKCLRPWELETIPDGVFGVLVRGEPESVAFEVELSLKARSRYRRVFGVYAEKARFSRLWYAVGSERIGQVLMEEWLGPSRRARPIAFAWTTLSEVLRSPSDARMRGPNGDFYLRDFARIKSSEREGVATERSAHPSPQPLSMLGRIAAANSAKLQSAKDGGAKGGLILGGMGEPLRNPHLSALSTPNRSEDSYE